MVMACRMEMLSQFANLHIYKSPKVFSPEYLSYCQQRDQRSSLTVEHIRDIQETILILVLFVDAAHESGSRWQDFVDEDENGLLWAELDALANDIDELSDGQVCRDEILLLVDGSDVRLLDLFADDLHMS